MNFTRLSVTPSPVAQSPQVPNPETHFQFRATSPQVSHIGGWGTEYSCLPAKIRIFYSGISSTVFPEMPALPYLSLKSLDPLPCISRKIYYENLKHTRVQYNKLSGIHHLIQYPPILFPLYTSTCLTPMSCFKENPKYHIIASVSINKLLKDTDLLEIFTKDKKQHECILYVNKEIENKENYREIQGTSMKS